MVIVCIYVVATKEAFCIRFKTTSSSTLNVVQRRRVGIRTNRSPETAPHATHWQERDVAAHCPPTTSTPQPSFDIVVSTPLVHCLDAKGPPQSGKTKPHFPTATQLTRDRQQTHETACVEELEHLPR
jgi:hypothetical protein